MVGVLPKKLPSQDVRCCAASVPVSSRRAERPVSLGDLNERRWCAGIGMEIGR